MFIKNLFKTWNKISLVKQIIIGLLIGIILALTVPEQVSGITILGDLFVGALKAVAPILVFFLVMFCDFRTQVRPEDQYEVNYYISILWAPLLQDV